MADQVTFSEEQQSFVDDLVGRARVKAREKAEADAAAHISKDREVAERAALIAEKKWQELAEMHQARVKELEPFEASAKEYGKLVENMLEVKVKALGKAAKKAMEALPDSMTVTDKLAWLNENEELFQATGDGVGTPARSTAKKPGGDVKAAWGRMGKPRL